MVFPIRESTELNNVRRKELRKYQNLLSDELVMNSDDRLPSVSNSEESKNDGG